MQRSGLPLRHARKRTPCDGDRQIAEIVLEAATPHLVAAGRERIALLRAAIKTVLDDNETGAGGWGPDVTMAAVLEEAMDATSPEETHDDH